MKTLGVGVRVWIGWCDPSTCPGNEDARLKTGTVVAGPFPAGTYPIPGTRCVNALTVWHVQIDGLGLRGRVAVSERVLFPIDDDDPKSIPASEPLEERA